MKISFLTFQYPKFYNDRVVLSCNMFCQVSRKMPLGKKISLGHFSGRHFSGGIFFGGIFRRCPEKCPREKSPQENCSPENYPPEILSPEKLPLENCLPKNCLTRLLLLLTLSYSCSFSNILQYLVSEAYLVSIIDLLASVVNSSN